MVQKVQALTLDSQDPFERAVIDLVEMNRRKRADYATDDDVFSNFRSTSDWAGFDYAWESALFNCAQKLERVKSLRENGRLEEPANEAVLDTVLDNAVYGIIAYALALEEASNG